MPKRPPDAPPGGRLPSIAAGPRPAPAAENGGAFTMAARKYADLDPHDFGVTPKNTEHIHSRGGTEDAGNRCCRPGPAPLDSRHGR